MAKSKKKAVKKVEKAVKPVKKAIWWVLEYPTGYGGSYYSYYKSFGAVKKAVKAASHIKKATIHKLVPVCEVEISVVMKCVCSDKK